MNRFKKYESYKESGLEWLGEIPKQWRFYRIDWINKIVRGNTGFKKDELLDNGEYIALQYGKTYKVDEINETFKFYVNNEFYKSNQTVHYGDTILISTSETIEDLRHSCFYNRNNIGLIGGEQILLKPNSKFIFDKYLYYYSKIFFNGLSKYATGLKVFRFNIDDLKNIVLWLPNITEQTKIATYLDTQTQKIDKEIKLLEEKSLKYKELKQTLINETVLRGLERKVKLKDSGIEWIGDVPEHWETERIKNIFNERVGKNLDKKTNEAVTKNILSVMKEIGVINHRDKGNVGNKMAEDITNYKLVYPNDIVVNKMNIMIGSVGISKEFGALSVIYIILITKKNSYAKYYDYFFKMKAFHKSLRKIATGILEIREAVNMTLFKQEQMTKPSYEEQKEIATYLDEKTQKIDAITKTITTKITLLKEFRKTLINDVVTGKVKVCD